MKKLIALSFFLVLGPCLEAADSPAAAATAVELVFEMSDGSRVVGTPSTEKLKLTTQYADLDFQLSKVLTISFNDADRAAQVNLQNGDVLNGKLAAAEIAVTQDSARTVVPLANVARILVRAGSSGGDFVNSLGMEFVTVPGIKGLVGIWDVRVQDYRAYADANPGADAKWKRAGFKQGDDHPVVNVNWADAHGFCVWLTQLEQKQGRINPDQEYRMPADKEWTIAVGKTKYPWGDQWPPPEGAGNYAPDFKTDNFPNTSPVGSFKANAFGLYDMGGNVWQWCEDWFLSDMEDPAAAGMLTWLNDDGGGKKYRLLRGASWADKADPVFFLTTFRNRVSPGERRNSYGFRCVLAPVEAPK